MCTCQTKTKYVYFGTENKAVLSLEASWSSPDGMLQHYFISLQVVCYNITLYHCRWYVTTLLYITAGGMLQHYFISLQVVCYNIISLQVVCYNIISLQVVCYNTTLYHCRWYVATLYHCRWYVATLLYNTAGGMLQHYFISLQVVCYNITLYHCRWYVTTLLYITAGGMLQHYCISISHTLLPTLWKHSLASLRTGVTTRTCNTMHAYGGR